MAKFITNVNLSVYFSSYETENGIKAEETGSLKKASGPDTSDVIIAQGTFSYTAPDGTVINLNYIADDENGFKPEVIVVYLNITSTNIVRA